MMTDLVGTCPKDFWLEWIAEGDAAGAPSSGEEWGWYTHHGLAREIRPGERFYVVAHGRLRGWAAVTRVKYSTDGRPVCICRQGGAVAITIDEPVTGISRAAPALVAARHRAPVPDWKTAGIGKIAAPAPLLEG